MFFWECGAQNGTQNSPKYLSRAGQKGPVPFLTLDIGLLTTCPVFHTLFGDCLPCWRTLGCSAFMPAPCTVVAVINASPHSRSMWAGTHVCEWLLVPSEHLMCVYIMNESMKAEMNEPLACPPPNDVKTLVTRGPCTDAMIRLRHGNTAVFLFLNLNSSKLQTQTRISSLPPLCLHPPNPQTQKC